MQTKYNLRESRVSQLPWQQRVRTTLCQRVRDCRARGNRRCRETAFWVREKRRETKIFCAGSKEGARPSHVKLPWAVDAGCATTGLLTG